MLATSRWAIVHDTGLNRTNVARGIPAPSPIQGPSDAKRGSSNEHDPVAAYPMGRKAGGEHKIDTANEGRPRFIGLRAGWSKR